MPSHPLIRLAVLFYVASLDQKSVRFLSMDQRALLYMTVEDIVSRWHLVRPESTLVEALLIISSVPVRFHAGTGDDLSALREHDPFGAGAISYILAKQIDLDEAIKVISKEVGGESRSDMEAWPALNRLCLVGHVSRTSPRYSLILLYLISISGSVLSIGRPGELTEAYKAAIALARVI